MDPLAQRVVARFLALATITPEAKKAAFEFLKHSKLHEVLTGMATEAKKDKQPFGVRDGKRALEAWFAGGEEPKDAACQAGCRFLKSDKGKNLMDVLVKGVHEALKKSMKQVGLRDVGEAVISYLA